jgi:peptidoglycan hydrolase FlgJ
MAAPVSSAGIALARYAPAQPAMPAKDAVHPNSPTAKAKAASQDFEAMFLSTMFNQMFESLKGDGPFGGAGAAGVWRSFLADEYARSFAKAGGVGIADQLYGTLLQQQEMKR